MRSHHENDLLPKRNLLKQLQPTGSKQLDYYAAPFRLCTVSTCHESGRCLGKEFLHLITTDVLIQTKWLVVADA